MYTLLWLRSQAWRVPVGMPVLRRRWRPGVRRQQRLPHADHVLNVFGDWINGIPQGSLWLLRWSGSGQGQEARHSKHSCGCVVRYCSYNVVTYTHSSARPGVEDGTSLRMHGQGDAAVGVENGPTGDLFIRISVTPSKNFKRQGADLFHDARIPMHTALLGGRVRVPTLDGEVDVRVPSGTQPGERMVLKGHGVAPPNRGKGDLYVQFDVRLPRFVRFRSES